jgi:myo-inositol-1-phosphate synthase
MAAHSVFLDKPFTVQSDKVIVTDDEIVSTYDYQTVTVSGTVATPTTTSYTFKTQKRVPKLGVMLVGWGGNNGSTVTAGVLANQQNITWRTKEGVKSANYFGSITQASTVRLGTDASGNSVHVPMKNLLPLVEPNDIILGGWDISKLNLGDAMRRARVLDIALQDQLYDQMSEMTPLPSIYFPDFIAANQADRADNVLTGTKLEQMEQIRIDICNFKNEHGLEKVIVLWTANTERFAAIEEGINDTADNLLDSIKRGEEEISPSTLFAVASILEGSIYINGSP